MKFRTKLDDAKDILIKSKDEYVPKDKIVKAFKLFWNSNPTEKEFDRVMNRVSIYPEIIYYMVKK